MKIVIDIPEDMYNDANILMVKDLPELRKIIANGKPYEETQDSFIVTECRKASIKKGLPLYFIYYEETGIFEAYITKTKELFEKRHCSKNLSKYEFENLARQYLDDYSEYLFRKEVSHD